MERKDIKMNIDQLQRELKAVRSGLFVLHGKTNEYKRTIVNLEGELECWKKKLDERTVNLKLQSGVVLEIQAEKIVKLHKDGGGIRSANGAKVAWVADNDNKGLVIHLTHARDYNYHLGRDEWGPTLIVTRKHKH